MDKQFASASSLGALENIIRMGTRECWRVSRLGVIIKVQNHCHGGKFIHMTKWVDEEIPAPLYSEMHVQQKRKLIDPKWGNTQLSIYANHSTYLVYRKGSQQHKRRSA